MANDFWKQWRLLYLQTFQPRRKWEREQINIQENDLVILKDNDCHRNLWPVGLIEKVFPGQDGLVRKIQVRVVRDGHPFVYVRPVTQIVPLLNN